MARKLYAVLAEVSTYGTLAIYTPYASISADTYLLPPPTTIVGALAYSYYRSLNDLRELTENGSSPAVELIDKKKVLYVAAGIVKPIGLSKSIERLYQHIYLKKPHWKRQEMAYTIGVRPISVVDRLQIFFILSDEELVKYCYGITRLGRKESLVAVDNVVSIPLENALTNSKYCETSFYFPSSIAKDYSPRGMWIEINMPILDKQNYAKKTTVLERYVVPKPFTDAKATVELNEEGVVLKMNIGDREIVEVPVPKQAIEI